MLTLLLGYFMFAFRNGPRKGHYQSQIQINTRDQNRATIQVGLVIVNRRPEQMYTSFDTRLEWPREGSLFELDLTKCRDPKQGHYSSQLLGHY